MRTRIDDRDPALFLMKHLVVAGVAQVRIVRRWR
jgi:hypothetical protein